MKKYFFIVILVIASCASIAQADTSSAAGFIPGQIWYSKTPLVEGDTVKIYTALWNGDTSPLSAHVEFYDSTTLLGARDVTIPPSQLEDVSILWKVTAGDHSISAKISSLTTLANGKKESINLDNNTTTEDKTFVTALQPKTDVIKDGIAKATDAVKSIVPTSVPAPIADSINSIDTFRSDTYTSIADSKNQTQMRLDALNGVTAPATTTSTNTKDKSTKPTPKTVAIPAKPTDATEKPIAYVKLFFFTILAFIFGNKIVFYGLITLIIFLILRFLYRKIRHKSRK